MRENTLVIILAFAIAAGLAIVTYLSVLFVPEIRNFRREPPPSAFAERVSAVPDITGEPMVPPWAPSFTEPVEPSS